MSLRILLLSAYDAMSHRIWRTRLQDMFPEHAWTQLALPPRHFNWRIRGNSLQWALDRRETLSAEYDLLIATSMVDLASLRGFIPALGGLPTLLYFHENQFVYPRGREQRAQNVEPQLVPLYAAYCADAIAFNSHYNRATFLQGAEELLSRLPDRLAPAFLSKLGASEVLPVPLEEFRPAPASSAPKAVLDVVWNHRWEYDKGPRLLLALAQELLARRLPIRLHVVGQGFRSTPEEFIEVRELLKRHAAALAIARGEFGFIAERGNYEELLRRCDVVLSTALHDFQGLAIQEACALGCTPLAPERLVYPEYLEQQFLYGGSTAGNEAEECAALLERLIAWQQLLAGGIALPKAALNAFSREALRPHYAELFARLAAG